MVNRRVFMDVERGVDKIRIVQVQDCDEITKINRLTCNANGSGTSSFWKKRDYVKIASIPVVKLDEWRQQGLKFEDPDDWKIIKRLLNSNEYSDFRTAPGRI
jgi:hypothetical protein